MKNLSYRGSNGIGDFAKHLHSADCIQDHNLDVFSLAISETVNKISQKVSFRAA
jgi:hypothetical protein